MNEEEEKYNLRKSFDLYTCFGPHFKLAGKDCLKVTTCFRQSLIEACKTLLPMESQFDAQSP